MEYELRQHPTDAQSIDTQFALLAEQRRRHVIDFLAEQDPPMTLGDVAAAVAARETDADEISEGATTEVATALHHVHLPKLANAGVVDYDAETNTVTAARAAALASCLATAGER